MSVDSLAESMSEWSTESGWKRVGHREYGQYGTRVGAAP